MHALGAVSSNSAAKEIEHLFIASGTANLPAGYLACTRVPVDLFLSPLSIRTCKYITQHVHCLNGSAIIA
jgi:hypothetical protein